MYQPQNGWAEQDADDWIDAAFRTTRAVIEESGINPSEIAGIGISGQMHGLVMRTKTTYLSDAALFGAINGLLQNVMRYMSVLVRASHRDNR